MTFASDGKPHTDALDAFLAAADSTVAAKDAEIAALKARIAELTTPPPVVVPPTGLLPYAPPAGWQNYPKITVPSTGVVSVPAGTDALIVCPSTITVPVTIKGGRNRVVWDLRLGGRTAVPSGSYDSTNRGIRLSDGDDAGIDHLEGIYGLPGTYFSDFIQIAIRTNNRRVVQIQNARNDGTTYGTSGTVHADVIQCWGGPSTLRVHNLTAKRIGYQGAYMDAGDGRTLPAQLDPWRFSNINFVGLSGAKYLFADRQPAFTRATASEVLISGSPYNNSDSFGNAPAGVKVGTVADFVPASLFAGPYVSPGYV